MGAAACKSNLSAFRETEYAPSRHSHLLQMESLADRKRLYRRFITVLFVITRAGNKLSRPREGNG